jgi:hypothetical protein
MQKGSAQHAQIYNKKLTDPSKMHIVKPKIALASRTELAALAALVVVEADPVAPLVLDAPVLPGEEAEEEAEDVLLEMPSPPVVVWTTAGQVKLNNGVVDRLDVMANLASLAGLESLKLYHQTLVLPNNEHPTVSQ